MIRFHSTPQSALNLEITKLAIIESFASVALYVGVGLYFETFRPLALAVVLAPLMLFRTEASANWGLKTFGRFVNWFSDREYSSGWVHFSYIITLTTITSVAGSVIRIVATLYWAARAPIQTLREAPQNWLRQSLCTDFFHPPEIIPLEATKGSGDLPTFANIMSAILKEKDFREKIAVSFVALPFFIVGYLPSLLYRLSFKATSIVYAPLIWVAHATLRNPLSVKARLERITKGELEKVRRGLSWLMLLTLGAKVAAVAGWADRSYVEAKFPSNEFVTRFIVLDAWPWWQITLGVDALLTFFLLFFADAALARLNDQHAWRDNSVSNIVSTASFLRAALSIATISHFFYIALRAADPRAVLYALTS